MLNLKYLIMNNKNKFIRFILIEDEHDQFELYCNTIKVAFAEKNIVPKHILPTYEDVRLLMQCWWDYTSCPEKIENFIKENEIIGENIIYFIDDRWLDDDDNSDGSTFCENILRDFNVLKNVIMLTANENPENYDGLKYICKSHPYLKQMIGNQILQTQAYIDHKKTKTKTTSRPIRTKATANQTAKENEHMPIDCEDLLNEYHGE